MVKKVNNDISAEVLSAFLDGNASVQESHDILDSISEDAELRELLHISQLVDSELGHLNEEIEFIPMTALAASCEEGAYCSLECEKYILDQFGISVDPELMISDAVKNGWYKENGTALHNVGRHLENKGLIVSRRYKATIEDISNALSQGEKVIVAVDGGELTGNKTQECIEDMIVGQIPDHTVVVVSVDEENIMIIDPNSINTSDSYPVDVFADAWRDSKNYLVTVSDMKEYDPMPIDLTDVNLPQELMELREAIAENAHDVWAMERKAQGWTYGPCRDDQKKETPCMVAYSQLPDSEKEFDREMAMNTLKLLVKLGYDIVRRDK